jgi:large subunit ribosomal protein L35Ae
VFLETFLNTLELLFHNMEGIIANFRSARHHQYDRQMIITVKGYSDKEKAKELVGKSVKWTSPAGKEIKGKISAVHGNSGAVRAIFDTGMPGQAVGAKIIIE